MFKSWFSDFDCFGDCLELKCCWYVSVQFSRSVVSDCLWPHELQHARLPCPSPTPDSWSSPKLMSIESVMLSNHFILSSPSLLPSIFSSIRVFSNKSALHISWPKYQSFRFNINPSNEHPGLISLGWTGWISLQSKGLSRVFQKHQFFSAQLSLQSNSHIHTWLLEKP